MVNKEEVCLEFISTNDQLADFLTKAITAEKLQKTKDMLKIAN